MSQSHMNQITEPGKFVSNANEDITNVITKENVNDIFSKILDDIFNKLKPHCGPKSKYALIIYENGGVDLNQNVFTKDGRHIVDRIDYASPAESYAKQMILYIGRRIDSIVGDGTTTSMMLASSFLSHMLSDVPKWVNNNSTYTIQNIFDKYKDDLINELDKKKITVESLVKKYNIDEYKAIQFIAWLQAMASSGGNVEISNVVSEVFKKTHETCYDYITAHRDKYESEVKFRIYEDESDYSITATTNNIEIFNSNLGTELLLEESDVFVIVNELTIESTDYQCLVNYLNNNPERNIIIVLRTAPSPEIYIHIRKQKINDNRTVGIFIYGEQDETCKKYDLPTLRRVAGLDDRLMIDGIFNENYIIKNAKVHYANHEMKFYNLYDKKDTDVVHPFFKNKELNPAYTKFVELFKQQIDLYKSSHHKNQRMIDEMCKIYNKLVMTNRVHLMIGGLSHDHQAAIDIITDVNKACIASIKHGFMLGSMVPLIDATKILKNEYNLYNKEKNINDKMEKVANDIFKHLIDIEKVINQIDKKYQSNCNIFYSQNPLDGDEFIRGNLNEFIDNNIYKNTIDIKDIYPIIQPANLYNELMLRINEIIVKLICTDKIIIPGSVYLEKK